MDLLNKLKKMRVKDLSLLSLNEQKEILQIYLEICRLEPELYTLVNLYRDKDEHFNFIFNYCKPQDVLDKIEGINLALKNIEKSKDVLFMEKSK